MSEYNTGTVSVTNGSNIVVGTGTAWLTNVSNGDIFTIVGSGVSYIVGSVTDDTHLVLTGNYAGATASGKAYTISTSFTSPDSIPFPELGDTQPATIAARLAATLQDLITTIKNSIANLSGVIDTATARTNLGKDNHFYGATITPATDADVTLTAAQYKSDRLTLADGSWTAAHNIIVPSEVRRYYIDNTGGTYTATVKTAAGTGIAVLPGTARTVVCDGTNVIDPTTALSGINQLEVAADSTSNVSRWVMNTNLSTDTYWAKILTLTSGAINTARIAKTLRIISGSGGDTPIPVQFADISFYCVETLTNGLETGASKIAVSQAALISNNDFMLVQETASAGQPINLWMRSNRSTSEYAVYEMVVSETGEKFTKVYNHGATWTATTPSGAAEVTSDSATVKNDILTDSLSVNSGSIGNVSRWVASTANGGVGTENGANTWAKLATFTPPATSYADQTVLLDIVHYRLGSNKTVRLAIAIRQDATGMNASTSSLEVASITGLSSAAVAHNSFKLTAASATNGSPVTLWVNKGAQYCTFAVYEVANRDTGSFTTQYHDNSPWQSTVPSGAVNLTSDLAGGGQFASTSLLNGWAGAVYYEKSATGLVTVSCELTTAGTTTNGTNIFSMPAGYIKSGTPSLEHPLMGNVAAGQICGRLRMTNTGILQLYGYASSVGVWRASFTYKARA